MSVAIQQARQQLRRGKQAKALHILTEELERNPNNGEGWLTAGSVMLSMGKLKQAEEALQVAKQLDAPKWKVHLQLGHTYAQMGCPSPAQRAFRESMAWAPEKPEARVCLAFIQAKDGHWDDAAGNFALALQYAPGHPGAIAGAASVLSHRKEYADAWRLIEPWLRSPKPDVRILVIGTQVANQLDRGEQLLAAMKRAMKHVRTSSDKVHLLHSLGSLHDKLGNHAEAFAAFDEANATRKLPYDIDGHVHTLALFPQIFPAEFFETPSPVPAEKGPVLIVGAPRSGTSLTEQMLSAHPEICGGGELEILRELAVAAGRTVGERSYLHAPERMDADLYQTLSARYMAELRAIDPAATYVTDKMPHNFFHLALAAKITPGAKIIHVTRDPTDTLWSCYRQNFKAGLAYTTDLDTLGQWYGAYRALMTHWSDVLPITIHEVRYEDLVRHPEDTLRSVLTYLDLPFDEACLHPHKNERAVATASAAQVQQPIHGGWVGRSKPYLPFLGPLTNALGKWSNR